MKTRLQNIGNTIAAPFVVLYAFETFAWGALRPVSRWLFIVWQAVVVGVTTLFTALFVLPLILGIAGIGLVKEVAVSGWVWLMVGVLFILAWLVILTLITLFAAFVTVIGLGAVWFLVALFWKKDLLDWIFVEDKKPDIKSRKKKTANQTAR